FFYYMFFFFFSSRRRHTRSKRDWSSDVCSSDLPVFLDEVDQVVEEDGAQMPGAGADHRDHGQAPDEAGELDEDAARAGPVDEARSEERRVGKECRSGWAPDE